MRIEVTHSLSANDARRVARNVVSEYVERFERYSPVVDWQDEDHAKVSITAKGLTLRGTFSLIPSAIVFEAAVPFLLRPFSGKAQEIIEKQVELWAGRSQRGEL